MLWCLLDSNSHKAGDYLGHDEKKGIVERTMVGRKLQQELSLFGFFSLKSFEDVVQWLMLRTVRSLDRRVALDV